MPPKKKKKISDEMTEDMTPEEKRFFKKMTTGKGPGFVGGFLAGVGVVIFGLVAIFIFAIIGALMGAITGWILMYTPILGPAIKEGFASVFGVEAPNLIAIGAMLGFIAGFFKHGGSSDCGKGSCC
jgi:hypothetical protein